jgi:hypothetical protein
VSDIFIAWWNVENLFDVMDWEERARKVKNVSGLKEDLETWDDATLTTKLSQLASVIQSMNAGQGPDLLGVCEVENRNVLTKLVQHIQTGTLASRQYDIIHQDTKDERGIDVAFIFDSDLFEPYHMEGSVENSYDWQYLFSHEVIKRNPTRDIVQVNLQLKTNPNSLLVFIGNHWPARISGIYETEPYRILAAETLSYYIRRIQEIHGKHTPVIVMGDFNDDPGSRSLTDYALSTRNTKQVIYSTTEYPRLLNLMWPLMNGEYGTFWYSGPFFYDQFLVTKGLLVSQRTFSVVPNSVQAVMKPEMWETHPDDARHPIPRAFGWTVRDPPGYSDHFPIVMKITS